MYVYIVPLLLVFLSYLMIGRSRTKHLLKKYPNPPGLPLVGNVYHFVSPTENLKRLAPLFRDYGHNLTIKLFHKSYIIVTEPKFAEFLLSSPKLIDKSDEYRFFIDWFGFGLLTSTGQKWKSHRKILTPSFHYKILEEFVNIFDKQSFVLVEKLKKEAEKDSFDVFRPLSLFTLDVICESAMGTQVNAQENPDSPFVSGVRSLAGHIYARCFSIRRFDWIYYRLPSYQEEKRMIKVMRDFSEDVIRKRKEVLQKNNNSDDKDEDENIGIKKKFTFLDVLLESTIDGKPISDNDIREEVDTFLFEGHDTTSVALSFTLYCLSKHLDVQAKVYQELKTIYGDDKSVPTTYDMLHEMKYLEQVIKESLRLYPSVPVFARKLEEDVEYDGTVLPKGLSIAIISYFLHRNPDSFPDPERFDPERFSVDNSTKRSPFAYVPFSAGPRNCIGQKFAMLEMKCTVAKILRHFEILPATPEHVVQPMIKITLESANGIKIKLKRRV